MSATRQAHVRRSQASTHRAGRTSAARSPRLRTRNDAPYSDPRQASSARFGAGTESEQRRRAQRNPSGCCSRPAHPGTSIEFTTWRSTQLLPSRGPRYPTGARPARSMASQCIPRGCDATCARQKLVLPKQAARHTRSRSKRVESGTTHGVSTAHLKAFQRGLHETVGWRGRTPNCRIPYHLHHSGVSHGREAPSLSTLPKPPRPKTMVAPTRAFAWRVEQAGMEQGAEPQAESRWAQRRSRVMSWHARQAP
jgi:hypothetical protein